ncbi:kinase-like domain-containing protein [Armillaria luteobubalina]|uniref:Kinase-like domain-containing protein n=1 Tax=Armillaria luteobubalina TaxID=153913 RepID=A0AA39U4T0_9AGAR|nr:kinase-like domain-containing protein [Armillaria luteobubalina]
MLSAIHSTADSSYSALHYLRKDGFRFSTRCEVSFINPPYSSSRPSGSAALAINIETLKKLVEDHDHLPRTWKLLKAMDHVVDCLNQPRLSSIGPEVTLHQMLKENIRSIRALKWYKHPFSKKTARYYTEAAKALSIYDGLNTNPGAMTSLQSLHAPRRIVHISPEDPHRVINFLQRKCDMNREDALYHSQCFKCLSRMTRYHGILPTSFFCEAHQRIGVCPIWGGGFADIWKGRMDGELICIKVLRVFMDNGIEERNRMIKDFCCEALVWRNLYHPSILPFFGVSRHLFAPSFCLISPWMEYGNIMTCLEERPQQIQWLTAISQVAEGITYLHSLNPPIVHADIRGANILVKDDLSCCLSNFGLALAVESQTAFLGDSLQWMPPEIMDDSQFYTAYIYTGRPPFSHIRKEAVVIHEVLTHGKRPDKPVDILDWTWGLVSKCLVSPASQRPMAQTMVNTLTLGLNV